MCHLCITGVYSIQVLQDWLLIDIQQNMVAKKYLEEKKTWGDQITDMKWSFFSQGRLSL